MLTNYRKSLEDKKSRFNVIKESELSHKLKLKELEKEQQLLQQSREIFQKSALITQNHLAEHLSSIVTKALQAVFYEKDVTFAVEFVERRNTTECDMYIEENGYKYSLMSSRGFGMADIASFTLLVAYILLDSVDKVLVIDEPCRNLDRTKHGLASEMMHTISKELGVQFIIATHSEEFITFADKSFLIVQKDGISKNY